MDIFKYTKNFKDLDISVKKIIKVMGYSDNNIPGPIVKIIEELLEDAEKYIEIQGGIVVGNEINCNAEKKIITIRQVDFIVKGTIYDQLKESEKVGLFLCTAGHEIGDISKKLMAQGDYLSGYIFDVIGSVVVESAMDNIQEQFGKTMYASGFKITNRYSPGYCGWQTAEQHKLFSLLPNRFCGVTLTGSALMDPIKSISGIIGIGKNVTLNEYTCEFCDAKNCISRNKKK